MSDYYAYDMRVGMRAAYEEGYHDGLANAPQTGVPKVDAIIGLLLVCVVFIALWAVPYCALLKDRNLWRVRAQRNTTLLQDTEQERDEYAVALYRAHTPRELVRAAWNTVANTLWRPR